MNGSRGSTVYYMATGVGRGGNSHPAAVPAAAGWKATGQSSVTGMGKEKIPAGPAIQKTRYAPGKYDYNKPAWY
jgi:hypothetical protein